MQTSPTDIDRYACKLYTYKHMQNTTLFVAVKMAFFQMKIVIHVVMLLLRTYIVCSKIHFGHLPTMVQEAVKPIITDYISTVAFDKKF